MKKLLLIALILVGMTGIAQDELEVMNIVKGYTTPGDVVLLDEPDSTQKVKITAAKAEMKSAIEKMEKLKMEINFEPVEPDSFTVKKGVIFVGKDSKGLTVYYLKVGGKNYKIDSWDCNLRMNDQIYNIRSEGDSVKCYGDKGVTLFSIQ